MRVFADEIVKQIGCLLGKKNQGPSLIIVDEESSRRLTAKDIYILVRTRREADFIADALRAHQFHCVLQQTTNVFTTRAAAAIRHLLRAVEQPDQEARRMTAFSGPFFAADWDDLLSYRKCDETHPYVQMLHQWHQLMETGQIAQAFRAMQLNSGFVSRMILDSDGEQMRMDVAQVFEVLLEGIGIQKPSTGQIISQLESYMSGYDGGTAGPSMTRRLAGVGDAIQIMTIHKSKGLEAKCVFLFGGFLEPWRPRVQSLRYEGTPHVLIGVEAGGAFRKELDHQERRADERLYYVGLTRAGAKLYLPHIQSDVPIAGPYQVVNDRLCALSEESRLDPELFDVVAVHDNWSSRTSTQVSPDSGSWTLPQAEIEALKTIDDTIPWQTLRARSAPLVTTSYSS